MQLLGFLTAAGLFAFIFIVGPDFIVPTQANDALTVADMSLRVDRMTDGAGGYYYTALILSYLPTGWDSGVLIAVAALFLSMIYFNIREFKTVSLATFLCVAPIILVLGSFVKDTFTPILVAICLFTLSSKMSRTFKVVVIALVYTTYGIYFRHYYFLIEAVFLAMVCLSRLSWRQIIPILLIAIIILMLLPDSYFYEIGDARDFVNRGRMWESYAGSRTVFNNLLPPTSALNFVINYFYAAARLNAPLLFNIAPQELFLTLNVIAYAFLSYIGMKAESPHVRLPTLMFVSHILVLMIFEPDLGSYLRHASSVLPYLAPALVLLDRRSVGVRRKPAPIRRARARPMLRPRGL